MITSFKCKHTQALFERKPTNKLKLNKNLWQAAYDKLLVLNAVENMMDLRNPPSNHFEALKGDRKGQYSIRINKKWRICFCFENRNVSQVEIVDYH